MSYTNETTHYGIPKPLGTDLTVPMDYNEAADAIDQALFDASTNATEAVTAANNAVEAAAEAVEDVGDLGTEVNNLKGRTSALEATEIIQNNKIDALELEGVTKFDSVGIADAYVNGLTYSVGDVVTYNGQRYKCTTAVVAAEPFDADKWSAEDVETVLNNIKSDLGDLTVNNYVGSANVNLAQNVNTPFATFNITKNGIAKANFHIMLTSNGVSLSLAVKVNGTSVSSLIHGGSNVLVVAGVDYTMDCMFEVKAGDVVTFEAGSSASSTIVARCYALTNLS